VIGLLRFVITESQLFKQFWSKQSNNNKHKNNSQVLKDESAQQRLITLSVSAELPYVPGETAGNTSI